MNETILLVEDEATIRLLMTNALTSEGYRVLESRHGEDALKVFHDVGAAVDLVITDMRMPHVGGVDLIQALRAIRATLKVICISGYPLNVPGDLCEYSLMKPFSREQLLSMIRTVLDDGE